MQRDYRLALYALGLSAVVLLAAGATVVAGVGSPSVDDRATNDRAVDNRTANESTSVTVHDGNRTVTLSRAGDGGGAATTFTLGGTESRCGGFVAVDTSNATETEHRVNGTAVTVVVEDGEETVEAFGRERLAELVWDAVSDRAGLGRYDRVVVRTDVYYESIDRERSLDVAGVTVRPTGGCLPAVDGEVDLDDGTVTVDRALPSLDGVEVAFTDSLGVLSDDDRTTIERRIVSNNETSYRIQRQFDDPERLNATVVEATNDGRVDIELTAPGADGRAVVVTVDLDDGRIVQSWTRLRADASSVVTVDSDTGTVTGNGTVTFEVNSSDA